MTQAAGIHETFLRPGEFDFAGQNIPLRTAREPFVSMAMRHKERDIEVMCQNVNAARELIKHYGLHPARVNRGDAGYRQVLFEIWNGHVGMQRVETDALYPESRLS
jgi:hypothetical protein